MNDRCASGTGRFFEVLGRALEVDIDDVGRARACRARTISRSAACARRSPRPRSSRCSPSGAATQDIAASVHRAVAARTLGLVAQVGKRTPVVMTGGVAKNAAAVQCLSDALKLPVDVPQRTAARGRLRRRAAGARRRRDDRQARGGPRRRPRPRATGLQDVPGERRGTAAGHQRLTRGLRSGPGEAGRDRAAGLARLPGHDELRQRRERAWVLDEDGRSRSCAPRSRAGITFFDTADTYSGGASEVATGRLLRKLLSPRRARARHQGVHADDARAERPRAVAQAHPRGDRRVARSASAWTTSTSTRSTAGTTHTPIEETMEALHDVVRAGKARYIGASTHVRVAVRQGAARRRAQRLDASSSRCRTTTTSSTARRSGR